MGAQPLAESRGRAPGQKDRGQSLLKLIDFSTFKESRKYAHFSKILNAKNQIQFVLSLQKMKFSMPQYITDYSTLMKINRLVHFG